MLVGPPGVWVLEVENFSGKYRNIGEKWECCIGMHWNPYRKSPSRQAKTNAGRLGNFLKADGIQQWVIPVIVWANPEGSLTVENPSVAVWRLDHLPEELGNIWQEEKVKKENQDRIAGKLTKLCQNKM